MINNLDEFFEKIENPLENQNNIRRFVNAYATRGKNLSSFIEALNQQYSRRGSVISTEDYNSFYANLFNRWKQAIVSMSNDDRAQLEREGRIGSDFVSLQNYLRNVPDVKTEAEAEERLTNSPEGLQDVIKKYRYTTSISSNGWNHISSDRITFQDAPVNIEHSLYMNIDSRGIHKFSELFIKKCEEKKLPYNFVVSDHNMHRDDSFILYSDTDHLLEYYQTLNEVLNENADLKQYLSRPPILTGKVDNYIGYATEAVQDGAPTYQASRAKAIYEAIDYNYQQGLFQHPDVLINDGDVPTWKRASWNAVENKLEYLNSLPKKELKKKYGISPFKLKSKKFQKRLVDAVSDSFYEGFKKKSKDFRPVSFQNKKKKKGKIRNFFNKNQNNTVLRFSKEELQKALKSSRRSDYQYLKVANAESEKIPAWEQATWNIIDKKIQMLNSLSKKELKDRYGLKPRQLKRKKFLGRLFDAISDSISEGLENKKMDFAPVKFNYSKRKKNRTKFLEITNEEMQNAMRSTLSSITKTYPEFLQDVKDTIISNGKKAHFNANNFSLSNENYKDKGKEKPTEDNKKKTDEAATSNNSRRTKFQPKTFNDIPLLEDHQPKKSEQQTAEESSVDDFDSVFGHYHFVKDQIIQDLPYDSKEPSRYQGLMSDAEIKLSQEKIKTLHK